ncbi:MAG TPA: UDP-N-acetylglucosamine 2-epimerase (non-hydrolyzing) [Herpetosiphonaceae bacterium]
MKIGIVMGTRPEIMKNYSLVRELRRRGRPHAVIHTGQHGDDLMRGAVFRALGYAPDFVMPGPYALGRAVDWLRGLIAEQGLDLILVNGDTAAALAGALAAVYSDVALAHVEAGLRSFDRQMIEERNRIMVDSAAQYLFCYTSRQADYLAANRELRGAIFNVGNTTVDLLADLAGLLPAPEPRGYAYVTLHRKEFTDDPRRMRAVFGALAGLAERFPALIFPMHPRTRAEMARHGLPPGLLGGARVLEPVGPLESLAYQRHAELILTDSGCIQEEAYLLGVPCVTIRENTERPETLEAGANVVCGFEPAAIAAAAARQLAAGRRSFPPVYGEIGVAGRILDALDGASRPWGGGSDDARALG